MALSSSRRRGLLVAAVACLCLSAVPPDAAVAVPLVFPTSRSVVPFAVAGAFVLPALVALLFAALAELGRLAGLLIGGCVLAVTVAAWLGWPHATLLGALGQ